MKLRTKTAAKEIFENVNSTLSLHVTAGMILRGAASVAPRVVGAVSPAIGTLLILMYLYSVLKPISDYRQKKALMAGDPHEKTGGVTLEGIAVPV